jgi:UDP-N-acetylglucosamine 2-epimerase (non-hydrolysing)/GDP/UDP-N,N'-diacetylbacillosamine 2-epimerase (hydrolysing)
MSGGDRTGSIDDSLRNAISAFAHVHLTTCAESSRRLLAQGEAACRVFEVGEPALDVISAIEPLPWPALAAELQLDASRPFVLATLHPVTTEADRSDEQIRAVLAAIQSTGMHTVFTYPNTDAGHEAIVAALETWLPRDWLRIAPHLGSHKYLTLMRRAAVLVGNSSSGILEAPSFRLPVVNVGTRQHRRTRASNVIDADYDAESIRRSIERALHDETFRARLATCVNPYGDGRCAARTVDILERLCIEEGFTAKWLERATPILAP